MSKDFEMKQIGFFPSSSSMGALRTGAPNGKSPLGTPQFPGQQFGATVGDVRSWIKQQKRLKGYRFNLPTTSSEFELKLTGSARMLLGLNVLPDPGTASTDVVTEMQFVVNNEIVIDSVNPKVLSPDFCDDEYYFIPRPLSGTDQITIKFKAAPESQFIDVTLYYL